MGSPRPSTKSGELHSEWLVTTAGRRRHGTTREAPLARFEEVEAEALGKLPAEAYDTAAWKLSATGVEVRNPTE